MIYFLQHVRTGLIKIGVTKNYYSRIYNLRSRFGNLKYLGYVDGSYEEEKRLHEAFAHLQDVKTLKGREWFVPSVELLNFIQFHANSNPPKKGKIHNSQKVKTSTNARVTRTPTKS